MESEKKAVRDFHGPGKSMAEGEVLLPLPNDRPKPDMLEGDPNNSEFSKHRKIEIPESNPCNTEFIISPHKMPQIPPLRKGFVSNESPSHTVEPNTQEIQNIKNMILSLQLDLQEERCKREILEEKVRKFGSNLTRQSQEMPERKLCLSEIRDLDEEIPQNKSCLPALNTIKGVDEKIGELRSDLDLRLQNLDKSLIEIRSILANNPVGGPKGDKKSLLEAGPSKDKDYNRLLYKKLERGIFPRQISLKDAIIKSVDELMHKPWSEKTEIEAIMDQYYLDNLPPSFLRPDEIENENRTPGTKKLIQLFSNFENENKIL
jgi:hypothetical protein